MASYQATARLLNEIWESHNKSLKSLVYDKKTGQMLCSKTTYAQVCKILAQQANLQALLEEVPIADVRNQGLLYTAIFELVAGPQQKIMGGGVVKRRIVKHEAALRAAWAVLVPPSLTSNDNDLTTTDTSSIFPRYVRVNTLRTDTTTVRNYLRKALPPQLDKDKDKDDDDDSKEIALDEHIPDLLVLPSTATPALLQALETSTDGGPDRRGDVVLQDKSSCFSAYCLVHGFADNDKATTTTEPPRVYLDACAAPGNKTTHLAALVGQRHTQTASSSQTTPILIRALDRSKTRYQSLQSRVAQYVPKDDARVKVQTHHCDFLQTHSDQTPFAGVTDILLDPSCSGSGIFTRQQQQQQPPPPGDGSEPPNADNDPRLAKLASFQQAVLTHALTQFVAVERVVYSTCSLHVQENEAVVAAILQEHAADWQLVAPACLAAWPRRGQVTAGLTEAQAATLLRVDREDATNGFFVACFARTAASDGSVRPRRRVELPDPPATTVVEDIPPGTGSAVPKRKKAATGTTNDPVAVHPEPKVTTQAAKKTKPPKEASTAKRAPAWATKSGNKRSKKRRN
jgi:putative methyltransferase